MTAPPDDIDLHAAIAALRAERDAALARETTLAEELAARDATLAQRNTEYGERIEHQSATIDVLKAMSASPGDTQPVIDLICRHAQQLCNASAAAIYSLEEQTVALQGIYAAPPHTEESIRTWRALFPQPLSRGMVAFRAILDRRIIRVRDVDNDPEIAQSVRDLGVKSIVAIPMFREGEVIGSISINTAAGFSESQIALLQTFAEQAVIAISSAETYRNLHEALEQQTATAEVLQVINASPGNLAPVFDAILEKAHSLCGAAFGILWTFDGEHYHAVAFRNVPPAYSEFLRDPPAATPLTPLGRIAAGEAFAQIADMADEIFAAGGPLFNRAVELGGFRTIVGVPLRKDAILLGAITFYRQEVRPFSDKQIALLQSFAAQAVIAMENARLLDELRQRQEELRITFENMGDGVAMFDETPRLVAWNGKFQEIFNVPDAILEEHRTYAEYVRYLGARGDFGPTVDVEEQIRHLTEIAGEYHEYERVRPDGRVIEIRHNPVPGGGFVLIYSDITERKRSEAEIRAARDAAEEASRTIEAAYRELKAAQANLIQAEKMASLGQLTAGIAHEIKNPLNFVNNFATLSVDLLGELKEAAAPGFAVLTEQQRAEVEEVSVMLTSNLEKITEHGKRADGIVKAMLEHSRGSSGERRIVDLNALIDEALNLAYHGARAQDQSFNITLERDFGEGISPIEVNPQDMTRVFLNLFANGCYAVTRRAREGGDAAFMPTLKVTTIDAGEAVEIRVRDNGTGIPAHIRDKLFQPFFTTKPTGEGTGLGLSITYDIVTQQHGGSIAVDSKVGEYSEFTVRLPRNP